MKTRRFIERIVDDAYPQEITASNEVIDDLARQVEEDVRRKGYPDKIKGTYTYNDGGSVTFSLEFIGLPETGVASSSEGKRSEVYDVVPVSVDFTAVEDTDRFPVALSEEDFHKKIKGYTD